MSDNTSYVVRIGPDEGTSAEDAGAFLSLSQAEEAQTFKDCLKEWLSARALTASEANVAGGTVSSVGPALSDFGEFTDALMDCRERFCTETGDFVTRIIVDKSPEDLEYRIVTSYGELSEDPEKVDGEYAKSHNVVLDTSFSIDVLFSGEPEAVWEGSVFGVGGTLISPPDISYDAESRTFSWGETKALGTVRVTGQKKTDVYTLTIPKREDTDDEEAAYEATVSAFYLDEVAQLTVTPPTGEESCGGVDTEIDPDDPDDEQCKKKIVYIDGCSGQQKRVEYELVSCS